VQPFIFIGAGGIVACIALWMRFGFIPWLTFVVSVLVLAAGLAYEWRQRGSDPR
jgi:hypothetical protein